VKKQCLINQPLVSTVHFVVLRIPSVALWWVSGGAIGFLTFVLTVPFLRDLFKFAPLHRWAAALIAAICLGSILVTEIVKSKGMRKIIAGDSASAQKELHILAGAPRGQMQGAATQAMPQSSILCFLCTGHTLCW
jgi:hypothetical protein